MLNPNDNMSIGGFGLDYYHHHQIGHQFAPGFLRKSNDWLSALFYLLPPLLLVVRITLFIRKRAGTDFAVLDVHAGVEAILVMIACAVLAASRRTILVLIRVSHTSIGVLLVFYGISGLSAMWSAIPEYSAFRALEYTSQLIAIVVGISCFGSFLKAEKAVLMLGLLVALLGVAGTAKLTHFASLHTNQYAAGASMVLCYCFAEIPRAAGRRRRMLVVSAATGFLLVALGTCATTNVATFVGLLSAAVLTKNRTPLILALVLLALVLILVPILATDVQETAKDVLFPGKSDSKIQSLSGRLSMWKVTLAVAKARPFIGHGFAIENRLAGIGITTHNFLVQIFLDTGIVGLFLISVSVLMFAKEVVQWWKIVPFGLVGCVAAFISVVVNSLGLPIVGAQWLASSFTFAAFVGLYVNHINGVTNYRLPHSEFEYERCLGYKIVS